MNKVISVEFDTKVPKNGGGTYPGTILRYVDGSGKSCDQAWHEKSLGFANNAHILKALKGLSAGDFFMMTKEKNEQGFWEVKSIEVGEAATATEKATPAAPAAKSTWNGETPEERAMRRAHELAKFEFEKEKQKLIIRQSCLSTAVNHMSSDNGTVSPSDIILVAKEFEAYCWGLSENV
jgi:hypothetical protein